MKRLLRIFLSIWTLLILAYASVFVVLEDDQITSLHESIVPLQYIGTMLGVYEKHETEVIDPVETSIDSTLQSYLEWKQSKGEDVSGLVFLELGAGVQSGRIYSPTYTLYGNVSSDVRSLSVTLHHTGRELDKKRDVPLVGQAWELTVSVANEMMFAGQNTYTIEAVDDTGKVMKKTIELFVDFQRIELGDTVVYVDSQYIPAGANEDIVRTTTDLQDNEVYFLTHGCDESDPQAPILIEHDHQFRTIPACALFSLENEYFLWYEPLGKQGQEYLYSVHSASDGLLYDAFPLYRQHLGSVYYTLLFYDKEHNRLETLYAQGDQEKYIMRIERLDTETKQKELEIVVTDGNQMVVETEREKMYVYLYKEWDRIKALSFPGNRYVYRKKSWGDRWVVINQGPLYTLPLAVYAPRKQYGSTFNYSVILDGDTVYIDDSLKITTFDINAMGTTIDVMDRSYNLNDPAQCRRTRSVIHKNVIGDTPLQFSSYDYPLLVGAGWHFSSVKIFANGRSTGSDPDQLYDGYLYYHLGKERGNLKKGENSYTIKSYDNWGNEICAETVTLYAE